MSRNAGFASTIGLWLVLGSPAAAQMLYPLDVTSTGEGILFAADSNVPGIWKIENGNSAPYFTASKKFRTPLNAVRCVAVDRGGKLLAGDSSTRDVYRFGADAQPTALTGGMIGIPMGIAVTVEGDLLVSDLELHRIWRVPAAGGKAKVWAAVNAPRGMCLDDQNQLWVVCQTKQSQLVKISPEGALVAAIEGRPFEFPHDVAVAADGTAYVSDGYAKAVWRIPPGGRPEKWVSGAPLVNPVGLGLSGDQLLVADPHARRIFKIDASGKIDAVPAPR